MRAKGETKSRMTPKFLFWATAWMVVPLAIWGTGLGEGNREKPLELKHLWGLQGEMFSNRLDRQTLLLWIGDIAVNQLHTEGN